MRRVAILIVLGLIAAAWAALYTAPVETWLFRTIAFHTLSQPQPELAKDGELAVLFCGTGSPLPDASRGGPCTLIAAGGKYYLVDAGIDSARNLMLERVKLQSIQAVLVTHFHSDHIGELGEIRLQTWVAGRNTPLPVYGPPGIAQVVAGFNQAYALDAGYRTAHHGSEMLPPDAVAMVPHETQPGVVLDRDGLRIIAFRVHHDPANPAYGYRFEYKGRVIVVSGDTAPGEDLVADYRGADVLVHEGLSPQMVAIMHDALAAGGHPRQAKIFHDIPGYHTAPVDAAKMAREAHVHLLVFSHVIPILPNRFAERLFLSDVSGIDARIAHDGMLLDLPANNQDINETSLP